MDALKTMLMGCGALAIFSMVGCVGLVGVGTYAVDQSMRDDDDNHVLMDRGDGGQSGGVSRRPDRATYQADPFSEYQGAEDNDGWGDEAR